MQVLAELRDRNDAGARGRERLDIALPRSGTEHRDELEQKRAAFPVIGRGAVLRCTARLRDRDLQRIAGPAFDCDRDRCRFFRRF